MTVIVCDAKFSEQNIEGQATVKFTVQTDIHENIRMVLDLNHEDALELASALLDAAVASKQNQEQTVVYRFIDRTVVPFKNRFFSAPPYSDDDSSSYSMPVRVNYKRA